MSLLRRILTLNLCLSKAFPFQKRQVTSSAVPYPLGRRDPNSLPLSLTKTLDPNKVHSIDYRPISLRYRVATLVELSALDDAANISRHVVFDRFCTSYTDTIVPCNVIIDAMCRAKRYEEAIALFHYFFNKSSIIPNTLSFNLIIKLHCDEGHVDDALQLYRHFTAFFVPNSDTYMFLSQGLVQSGRINEAADLAKFWGVDWKVHNVLIRGFLDLGYHDKADELFGQVKVACNAEEIAIVSCTFMDYWLEKENAKALRYFPTNFPSKVTLLSGNKLLEVLFKHDLIDFGWAYFKHLLRKGIFDSETINIGVNEYFKKGDFVEALETFKRSPARIKSGSYNNIIARLCERRMASTAETLLGEMRSPDVATFRAVIDAYIRAGRVDDAIRNFKKMIAACLRKVAIYRAH